MWSNGDTSAGPADILARLAGRVRALRRTIRAAIRTDIRHEGHDATGLVTMVADASGRVQSVDISPDWFVGRGPAKLGSALFEAYQAVMTEVLVASLDRMDSAEREEAEALPEIRPDDTPSRAEFRYGSTSPAPTLRDVWAKLRELEERQYEREYQLERRLAARSRDERVVHGPAHLVELTVRDMDVIGISVSGSVGRRLVHNLAQDTLAAFRSLYSGSASASGASDEGGV